MAARAEDSLKYWGKGARASYNSLIRDLGNAESELIGLGADADAVEHILALLASVRSYADGLRYNAEGAEAVLQVEHEKMHEARERWEDEHAER